jgi:protein gp37
MGHLDSKTVPTISYSILFKQWGGVRKSRAGRLLDGRTYNEMPVISEACRA